jgi:hypothetical protein
VYPFPLNYCRDCQYRQPADERRECDLCLASTYAVTGNGFYSCAEVRNIVGPECPKFAALTSPEVSSDE